MKQEIKPEDSSRSQAFCLWMTSPMPMVTLTKTFDITRLVKLSRKKGLKLNMLLCWCIAKAATGVKEFYTLPEGGKLFVYDCLAVNVIVNNVKGGINSCDIPYIGDFERFLIEYNELTEKVKQSCESIMRDDCMVVGTSAMVATEIDTIVNQYTDKFSNPMVMWGKYRKRWLKILLPISFQFHHVQMDGGHAALFLEALQQTINEI